MFTYMKQMSTEQMMNDYIAKQTKIKTEAVFSDATLMTDLYTKTMGTFNGMLGFNQNPVIKEETKPIEEKK